MATYLPTGYSLPIGDQPLTYARMLHARNWLTGGVAIASSTAADFFADAPLNSLTYERWQPGVLGATWTYDHGASALVDTLGIAAHTIGSVGAALQVLTSLDDVTYTPRSDVITPTNDETIWCVLPRHSARYFRVELTGVVRPVLGVIKFGLALQFPRAIFAGHTRERFARETVFRTNETETGEWVGRSIERVARPTSYQWQHLPRAWTEANWPPLQRAVEREPFFLSWRPLDYGDAGYFRVGAVPEAVTMGVQDFYEAGFDVRGYSYD